MPVSLSEWRVRIGKFRCRGRKEYDYNYFWRKLDHLIKRNKRAESPKNNTPKCNTSSPNGSSNVAKSSGGPSCDINNSRGNVNSPGKKDTSHSEALCAENSGSSTAKETNPVPDSTDVNNLAIQPCEEDDLDNRYITIHQISISNKKSAGYPSNYTQCSKTDQSDVSILEANNHSPAAVADGPVLSMESIRPDKKETSNSAPSGIGDQSSGLSPKLRQDTTRYAEQTTPIEKCHGSQTYAVLVSGPTSDEADDTKDIDCPNMTNTLLLRSGDVELNPGPNDTVLSNDEQYEDKDKYHSEGIFDQTGGELHISSCGLTLCIPPGALPEGSSETITLDVLTDIPSEITLRHDDTLVNFGFQCLPSGLQFESEKPAILRIPHCASLFDPTKVQVVLYSMNHDGDVDRIVQTSRTCRVTDSYVEISLKHFSKGFLAFLKNSFFKREKRMSFMPFLPKTMPQHRTMMLEFRMVNKPSGSSWRDVHGIRDQAEYQPAKDDDDEMNVNDDDMEVTCQLSDNDTLEREVDAIFIRETKHTFYFELDFNGKADDQLVKLKVKQSERQIDIHFRTHFLASRGIGETSPGKTDSASPRPWESTSVDMPLKDAAASVLSINEQDEDEGETEIDPEEAIMNGMAPWNRSRIMVIGPAGVGKTSLIRRLTGQKCNLHEQSTKGAEQNVVTNSRVSSWLLVNDAKTAKDDLLQSIAMDRDFRSQLPCSTGEGKNRSDPEITGSGRSIQVTGDADRSVQVLPTNENEQIAQISKGITREEITKVKSSKRDITYSMWDFGGQEIYYITHPLFLSWRSLYILVIPLHLELSDKAPREEDSLKQLKGSAVRTHRTILDLVHFWLMSVYTHAVPDYNLGSTYEPKVLLIGTFAGDVGPEIIEKKATDKFKELKERLGSYPYWKQVLSPMCAIDNQFSQTSEVNKIQDRIDGLVKDSAYMKVQMPIKWRIFATKIEDSDENTLTVKKAHSIMKTWGINDLKEVKAVLKFYHDIGHLIYHEGCELVVLRPQFLNSIVSNITTVSDDEKMAHSIMKSWRINDLKEVKAVLKFYDDIGHLIYLEGYKPVLLKPQFLNSIFSDMITVIEDEKMKEDLGEYWRDRVEKGILSIELIKAVWKEQEGHHDQLNNIIDMMMKFDLICEIPNRPDGKRVFFVPCRSSPMLDEREIHEKDDKVEFTIDFQQFLPDGFLHRFYVRMALWSMKRKKLIEPTFHCRQMVFYIDNDHRVVMTNETNSKEGHQIKVMIYAVTPYGAPSEQKPATVNLNNDIIDYLHETLEDLKNRWARRIQYRVGIWCPLCANFGDKKWIHIKDILKAQDKTARYAEGCAIYVGDIQRAFAKDTTETSSRKPVSASQRPSASISVDISPQDVSAAASEASISKARVLSISEQHEDKEIEHYEQPISAWMECTTQPTDEEVQIIESSHHIFPPSTHQDEIPVENLESRKDLSDGTGIIRLEKHGIEVRIPPNEAYRAKDVTVKPIHDIPPELVLKETEAIISIGLRMSPSNATFDIPVRVRMPHCGIFTKPEAAEVVTYYRKSASESFTAIPSTNGRLRCVVRHRDLDIYMNHFSEIWIVAVFSVFEWIFIGKRVICTPYIPVSTPKNEEHELFVHVRDENITKGEVQDGYKAPITGEQFFVKWRSGGLKITCKESTHIEDELTTIKESQFRHLTEHKVMFTVDTRTTDMYKVILHFILKQSTTKQLLVPMHLKGITETSAGKTESASLRSSASTSVNIPRQGPSAATGEAFTSKEKLSVESDEQNFDGLLKTVADQICQDIDIDNLGEKLGFKPPDIERYIQKNRQDHTFMGTLHMLRDWRKRTKRSEEHEQLTKALIAIKHNRLAYLVKDHMASKSAVTKDHLQPKEEGIPNNPEPWSTNEDERSREEKQTKSHGSEDGNQDGPPRNRNKKPNRKTDSTEEDERTRGENQTKSHGSKDSNPFLMSLTCWLIMFCYILCITFYVLFF